MWKLRSEPHLGCLEVGSRRQDVVEDADRLGHGLKKRPIQPHFVEERRNIPRVIAEMCGVNVLRHDDKLSLS